MDPRVTSFFGLRDPVSASSHLFGFIVAVFAAAMLWRLARGDRVKQLSLGVFGLCAVLLYLASGTYHALMLPPGESTLVLFQRLDHSAIYLLIAGSYTPVYAILLRGWERRGMLALIWGLAAVGIACKWLLPMVPFSLSVGLYVAMGWLGLLPLIQLFRAVGVRAMLWGLGGGALYMAGGLCDACKWPNVWDGVIRSHEVFHLLDLAATGAHLVFFVRYLLPFRPRA
jgi:hemolysin III